ncbi:MAG: VOC family protein [Caulobacteraceae bacterium]|nr:VOC family protein [Caulobacteraceae bacterium]
MSDQDHSPPGFASAVCYRDPAAALKWLEGAFGFEPFMVITTPNGQLAHSEMRYRTGRVMVGSEWSDDHKSPASIGGKNTQTVHTQLDEDLDAHCERARAAGAEILAEPEDQFYGDRTYRARDPEGHIWTFSRTVKVMTREEWDAAGGFITKDRL